MQIPAYTLQNEQGKITCLGLFDNFGRAREAQQASLPDDLKEAYAGIQDGRPIFYAEMLTPELKAKYPPLAGSHYED